MWRLAFVLARQAQDAGLVVVKMDPFVCTGTRGTEFAVSLWQPDGTLWAEGTHETMEAVRTHLDRWKNYKKQEQTT